MTDNVVRFPERCDCLEMGPLLLKVEPVRVRFLSYSEEAVRQRPFSSPPGGPRGSLRCVACGKMGPQFLRSFDGLD